jgi:putative transcriptional regulator
MFCWAGRVHSETECTALGVMAALPFVLKDGAFVAECTLRAERVANPTYHSDVTAAVHEMARGMFDAGIVNKQTMWEFDDLCLVPVAPMPPEEIRQLRERELVSQPVFARYLNVSRNLVSDWERGVKNPGGPALRLLAIVKKSGLGVLV